MLLGVATNKMLYESYGIGGWLQWGALLVAAIASPMLSANAAMSGRPVPDFPRSAGATRRPNAFALTALLSRTLLAAQTALGFAFDPRYRHFPFASLTMAGILFAALILGEGSHAADR